ncbi:MAG: hypothetical protein Q7U11_11225 [Phenylobacterium sp.]|uniref:hypothetical protein n=1 Tax=Phenylobacterium sp. TaxID=1871053 RepID=UPI002725AA07|nr:hypothetical protein [Phenylobacterium sp.]MDO9247028.1 hypothetical protein [Phenylobacterium sp.]MDP3631780.1 hypothetical protein [Phenylobacterium sp.]MDP3870981.1 hypothetical protein [Phenylobacterium sp.]
MKTLIAAAALLALAACGPKPAAETKTAAAAPISCAGLPDYAPVYPGAKITLCTQGDSTPGKIGGAVGFTSRDAPDTVMARYRGIAAAAGLKTSMDLDQGGSKVFSAMDGDRTMRIQALPEADGGATAILTWGAAKPS